MNDNLDRGRVDANRIVPKSLNYDAALRSRDCGAAYLRTVAATPRNLDARADDHAVAVSHFRRSVSVAFHHHVITVDDAEVSVNTVDKFNSIVYSGDVMREAMVFFRSVAVAVFRMFVGPAFFPMPPMTSPGVFDRPAGVSS